jgi:hypothetical protein
MSLQKPFLCGATSSFCQQQGFEALRTFVPLVYRKTSLQKQIIYYKERELSEMFLQKTLQHASFYMPVQLNAKKAVGWLLAFAIASY